MQKKAGPESDRHPYPCSTNMGSEIAPGIAPSLPLSRRATKSQRPKDDEDPLTAAAARRVSASRPRETTPAGHQRVAQPMGTVSATLRHGLPLIMMMQASTSGQGYHLAHFWGLDRAGLRTIHIEGKMYTKSMIIGDIHA